MVQFRPRAAGIPNVFRAPPDQTECRRPPAPVRHPERPSQREAHATAMASRGIPSTARARPALPPGSASDGHRRALLRYVPFEFHRMPESRTGDGSAHPPPPACPDDAAARDDHGQSFVGTFPSNFVGRRSPRQRQQRQRSSAARLGKPSGDRRRSQSGSPQAPDHRRVSAAHRPPALPTRQRVRQTQAVFALVRSLRIFSDAGSRAGDGSVHPPPPALENRPGAGGALRPSARSIRITASV